MESQVEKRWQEIKRDECGDISYTEMMGSIPKHLRNLLKSTKVLNKAADAGFEWNNYNDALDKLYEEIEELNEARRLQDQNKIYEEIGDLIFSVANLSRLLKIEPEMALSNTIGKFIKRFGFIESHAAQSGRNVESLTLAEMIDLWSRAKYEFK